MFNFFGADMMGDYDHRKVGRLDKEGLMVSTARVTDGDKPYETAIKHPLYNKGGMIIVEAYSTKSDALIGHAKWEKTMTSKNLPKELADCCNSEVMQMMRDAGGKIVFKKGVR
jgi:hypothetical protein